MLCIDLVDDQGEKTGTFLTLWSIKLQNNWAKGMRLALDRVQVCTPRPFLNPSLHSHYARVLLTLKWLLLESCFAK